MPEAIEHARQIMLGDAAPGVGHRHDDLVDPLLDRDRHPSAARRELDRVAEQVLEYLRQSVIVCPDLRNDRGCFDDHGELERCVGRRGLMRRHDLAHHALERHRRELQG
ncbi:MAG TPA: hypothetical protein VFQ53_26685 [Kofleriaceae bacterium]|nr:hypothetical protein [Kofleriaceae bacterium]